MATIIVRVYIALRLYRHGYERVCTNKYLCNQTIWYDRVQFFFHHATAKNYQHPFLEHRKIVPEHDDDLDEDAAPTAQKGAASLSHQVRPSG